MRNALKREWARWRQERAKRQYTTATGAPASAMPWLDRLRWWLLPLVLGGVLLASWTQLHQLTKPQPQQALPIILDAPLASAHRLGWTPAHKGHYFRLRSKGLEGRFVAYAPGPGTRAYQGNDAVALFGTHQPHAELTPRLCRTNPPPDDITFVTGDGLLLWLCQHPQNEERFALRRLGWRFPAHRWSAGLTMGKSASNDIVAGSTLLPAHALHLELRGTRLYIKPAAQEARLPPQHRLLCFGPHTEALPTPPTPKKDADSKADNAANKTPTKPAKTPTPAPQSPCQQAPFFLESGQSMRVYSRHHQGDAVTLRWGPSLQEKGAYDLRVTPADGPGVSSRRLSLAALRAQGATGFLVGNAEVYFRSIRPNAVRTQDLDELVHELLLRQILQYAEPDALRGALRTRYQTQLDLEQLARRTPMDLWLPQRQALVHNRYLRNRIWMANRSLAQHYRLQARTLFRIRWGRQGRPGALLGLGVGGGTLRAPRHNLLQPRKQTQAQQDVRLTTALTAAAAATPYLQKLDNAGRPIPGAMLWLTQTPTELLVQPGQVSGQVGIPNAIAKRGFQAQHTTLRARTVLWRGEQAYTSHHPFAHHRPKTRPTPTADGRPTRFLYPLAKRWWKRGPDLQRSSKDWPIEAIAARLGTLLTQAELAQALRTLNKGARWLKPRKHCGNQSKREAGRWRHKRGCWGEATLVPQGTRLLVPCSPLVQSKLRERFCKPGSATPHIDDQGRPLLPPVATLDGLYGVALLPPMAGAQHTLKALPGTLPLRLDGRAIAPGKNIPLRDGAKLRLGAHVFQFKQPTGQLANARFRGEYITSHYPEGPTFAHVIAGSVGGPFRNRPKDLQAQLPPPPANAKVPASQQKPRRVATTLAADLQRSAYAIASRHFARMDSAAFQKQFRRRYIKNPHKPHAGAVLMLNRRNGQVLTALSFPAFDPNLPPLQSQVGDDQRSYRYMRGQIVDRYGMTDSLLAYHPSRLPPNPPKAKRLEGRPDAVPDFLQALRWDREEELRGIRGDARSGWLLERAFGGAQTPGSTAKLVTAMAYTRYLRRKGRAVRFPKHTCAGGLMFMRQRRGRKRQTLWRPSTLRFRCHKREGHGHLNLTQAMASSCNVYFAKLALEMAGADPKALRQGKVRWVRNRHGGQGKYQQLRIPSKTLSSAMRRDPNHRALFRTAAALGFGMRYTYREGTTSKKTKRYPRYTDAFWEAPMTRWPQPPKTLNATATSAWRHKQRKERRAKLLPGGSFGQGRFFGNAAAYPAWQQWVHGATEPRHQKPTSIQKAFGSTDASLRAMAYVGFGQGLIATPLRIALVASVIANGGWLPQPQLWRGDWEGPQRPTQTTPQTQRPKPKRVIHAADARLLQQALAAVTMRGTASKPFAQLNRQCLHPLGLQVIGKTGTAEDRSQRARASLRDRVKRAGKQHQLPANRRWFQKSGCYKRKFWRHYYPEENIADSLFVGAIVPHTSASTKSIKAGKGWRLQDLAFAVVVKNGYHPEGVPCRSKGRDLDRAEARYLAHDVLIAAIQQRGACLDYKDTSRTRETLKAPRKRKRTRRSKKRKRRTKRRTKRRKIRKRQRTRPRRRRRR